MAVSRRVRTEGRRRVTNSDLLSELEDLRETVNDLADQSDAAETELESANHRAEDLCYQVRMLSR